MNVTSFLRFFERMHHKLKLHTRYFNTKSTVKSFAKTYADDAIRRIYIINLDRQPERWCQVKRELERFRDRCGVPLTSITRRFSAIDARYLNGSPDVELLRSSYSLADQLRVEPNALLQVDEKSQARRIEMTPQEVAVALSHIEVWKLVATGDVPYTLVLEDDIYFRCGFAQSMDAAWFRLMHQAAKTVPFDLLYLSFQEVGNCKDAEKLSKSHVRRPNKGLWQASGYVLTQTGAAKLLERLPAYGPIDLWMNLQFGNLNVLIMQRPIIEQRIDVPSTNSYSVLPVLAQVGVFTREKSLVAKFQDLPSPVFAYGEPYSGQTALATALSMLGYTCCSDIRELSVQEQVSLFAKTRKRRFTAYVNIGTLNNQSLVGLASSYPNARFISTTINNKPILDLIPGRVLHLPYNHQDPWSSLTEFLGLEYPAFPYPTCNDIGQRETIDVAEISREKLNSRHLKFDTSPWIVSSRGWHGIAIADTSQLALPNRPINWVWSSSTPFENDNWKLRDDTFPSNLALFTPSNFTVDSGEIARLCFRNETTPVRSFTSAAIASKQKFLYGKFTAELRPPRVPGLVTGMFLHRNGPRQEIDIEFLGKDTTKILLNVYYNPGVEGTKLEYGYRGTPTIIELGFDAADELHRYEIEWQPHVIRWWVDERVVHERVLWDPTPIPNLPLELNVNLWHSRSRKLAGRLDANGVPAYAEIRAIQVTPSQIIAKKDFTLTPNFKFFG